MVSELAPVVLYLRNFVRYGDVVIIEQPEAHLHPAMQVEFVDHVVSLIKSGVRVILTTHSSWIIEKLSNLIARPDPSGDLSANSKQAGNKSLNSQELGVWSFEKSKRPKGSKVREVVFDEDAGMIPTDFDDVAAALFDEYLERS